MSYFEQRMAEIADGLGTDRVPTATCRQCGVSLRYLPALWRYCSQSCRDASAAALAGQREMVRLARAEQKEVDRLARIEERWKLELDLESKKVRRTHIEDLKRPTIPYEVATADPYRRLKLRGRKVEPLPWEVSA